MSKKIPAKNNKKSLNQVMNVCLNHILSDGQPFSEEDLKKLIYLARKSCQKAYNPNNQSQRSNPRTLRFYYLQVTNKNISIAERLSSRVNSQYVTVSLLLYMSDRLDEIVKDSQTFTMNDAYKYIKKEIKQDDFLHKFNGTKLSVLMRFLAAHNVVKSIRGADPNGHIMGKTGIVFYRMNQSSEYKSFSEAATKIVASLNKQSHVFIRTRSNIFAKKVNYSDLSHTELSV